MAIAFLNSVPWSAILQFWSESSIWMKAICVFFILGFVEGAIAGIALLVSHDSEEDDRSNKTIGIHLLSDRTTAYDSVAFEDQVDIVAIHGLLGDPFKTWTATIEQPTRQPHSSRWIPSVTRNSSTEVNWLRDILPSKIDGARIFTYGYDGRQSLANTAANFLNDLASAREPSNVPEEESTRPIIFVCHGSGGNLVKIAMLQARTHPSVRIRSIFNRTRGVLFFGTRHVGKYRDSVLCRWGIFYSRLFSFVMIGRDSFRNFWRLLEDPEIERSNARFTPFLGQILITSFYGDHPDIAGEYAVPFDATRLAGCESIGIPSTTIGMVKFLSEDDPGLKRIISTMQRMVKQIISDPRFLVRNSAPIEIQHRPDIHVDGILKLLSLDGGGVRGLSALLTLRELILIAIMVGRLRMDIDSCIVAYKKLSRDVFERRGVQYWGGRVVMAYNSIRGTAWFDAARLEKAIQEILEERLPRDEMIKNGSSEKETPMMDSLEGCCKTFVCAINAHSKACKHLRSYTPASGLTTGEENLANCSIIEAARATSAAPLYFPTMKIGNEEFFDGALKSNNPVLELMDEVRIYLGNHPIKCLISIGTGKSESTPHKADAIGIVRTLGKMATDSEQPHLEIMNDAAYDGIRDGYFRFNVEYGLGDIGLERWDLLQDIERKTMEYLEETDMKAVIERSACLLTQ